MLASGCLDLSLYTSEVSSQNSARMNIIKKMWSRLRTGLLSWHILPAGESAAQILRTQFVRH
jgi:hypothetical protein